MNAVGLIVNLIYRGTQDFNEDIKIPGNMTVIFLIDFSLIFLLLFNLIIWKSDKIITDKIKIILITT